MHQSDPLVASALRVEQLIERAAARHPDKLALIFGERRWTYGQLLAELDRRAARLVEIGVRPGEIVLTTEPLSDDFLIAFLACCRASAIMLPLAAQIAPPELRALADRAQPRLVLTAAGLAHPILAETRAAPLDLPGTPDTVAMQETLRRSRDGGADELAFVRQTSSTTRRLPKLAVRAHRQLTARDNPSRWFWWHAPDRVYCLLTPDQFYVTDTCQVFVLGATLVQLTDVNPRRVEATLLAHDVTDLWTVPAILHPLAGATWPAPSGLRLRTIRTTSMRLPLDLRRGLAHRYGVTVAQQYSTTEAGYVMTTTPDDTPEGSVGRPIADVAVRLVDEEGWEVPEGEVGEVIVNTPSAMLGYLAEPEQTAAVLRDGWIWTGDLARRDPDGFYFLVGRRTLWINVGGSKVSPEEVEQVLEEHPGVREAAVTGAHDDTRGEVVRAVIVPQGEPPAVADLVLFCRARLAPHKVPRRFEFRESLPRSAALKLLRRDL